MKISKMYCNPIIMHFLVFTLLLINFFDISNTENVKKSVDDLREDNGETGEDGKDESMEIPTDLEPVNATCTRRQNTQMHEIRSAVYKQFPFMVAIMSQQNEYLCSGSIVSHGLILTSAKCADQPINYILMNTTSDKKDDTTTSLHIIKTEKFPSYSGSESIKDVAIIYTEKHNKTVATKINISNLTDTKAVNDIEALGFGLNTDVGKPKELQYIGVELRMTEGDLSEAFIDCIETKVPTCFKDYGGPVMLDNQLLGIVLDGSYICSKDMSPNYALNKRILKFLPAFTFKVWLDEKIRKNEEQEHTVLETYPSQPLKTSPVLRKSAHVMTSGGQQHLSAPVYALISVGLIATVV